MSRSESSQASEWPQLRGGEALWARLRADPHAFVRRVLAAVFREEARSLRLSVYLCGNDEMRRLHAQYLGDDSSTDVLSFPLETVAGAAAETVRAHPAGEALAEGEIVVCVDFVRESARTHGNSVEAELALCLVHGVLHLLGYDDADRASRSRMTAAEKRALSALGMAVAKRHD
ncbi:MAG: rRNA maturation RNase YbeY [Planctomycetota bacterium]